MNYLWAELMNKYPSTWKRDYFASPYNQNKLTRKAQEWSDQITGLTPLELRQGIDALSNREEKVWPPNAMEFKELCQGNELENVLDEIITRLQDGDSYQWINQLAYNIFMPVSSDFKNSTMANVPKLVKHRLRMIDKNSMFPLPDYTIKAIDKPVQENTGLAPLWQRSAFQSHMYSAIFYHKPELFNEPEDGINNKYISNNPDDKLSPLMRKIFSPDGTTELINKFNASGYIMPDKPIKPDFKTFSHDEWKVKFKSYKSKAIEAVTNFLHDQGLMS